jgi:phytoene dehydrogenase-like protein
VKNIYPFILFYLILKMSKIGIVGSGMGGLGLAIRSAVAGHEVTVFEANAYVGGKLAQIEKDGFRFDAGPSLFTMPHLVDELFTLAGKNPRDYFSYERLPEICRYFWEDGTRLQTNAKPAETAAAIASELGESAENVSAFLRGIGENYHIISELFLDNSLHSLSTWTGPKALKGLSLIHI